MQQQSHYDSKPLLKDVNGQCQYIDREIKRTWTMLGILILTCAIIIAFASGMN